MAHTLKPLPGGNWSELWCYPPELDRETSPENSRAQSKLRAMKSREMHLLLHQIHSAERETEKTKFFK